MATGSISAGKNIKFLLGSQANLESYITGAKQATEGTFYLTSDTHRLYVGTDENKAVPVNEGVITVANIEALSKLTNPHIGEFYYATEENILCVYASKRDGWVQINNNTNTYVVGANLSIVAADNVATITKQLIYNDTNTATGATTPWKIAGVDGVKVTASNNDTVTITGVLNKEFTVAVNSNKAIFTLEDTFGNKKTFSVKNADSRVTVEKDGTNGIAIGVANMYNTGVAISNNATSGFDIAVSDANGSVIGTFNPTITVGDKTTSTVSFENGNAVLPVYTKGEIDSIKMALNAMTYKGLVGTRKDEASGIQKWTDVMTANNVSVGDTYLFAEKTSFTPTGSTEQITVSAGSMAIARGTETNGVITSNLTWDYVEATNNTDTKYDFNGTASTETTPGSVELLGTMSGYESGTTHSKTLTFANGIETKAQVSVGNDGNITVKFNHEGHAATNTAAEQDQSTASFVGTQDKSGDHAIAKTEITTLKDITVNAQGHVTGFTTNTVTLKDTNAVINSVALAGSITDAHTASITSSVQLKDGSGSLQRLNSGSMNLTTNTLSYSVVGEALNIDLVWGSFS